MAITVFKTFINGEVLLASDLNSSITTLLNEINVHGGEIDTLNGPTQGRSRNLIINGDFSIWQRATSQTTSGYGADDRWSNFHSGSTKTASQQIHTVGVATNPTPANKYYSRTVVTSVVGANNRVEKIQSIESVVRTAGKQLTLSFWAKADSAKNIATELLQAFGTGGSPSAPVTSIGVTTHALTTSWQKFTTTVTLPSILGKTLGTNSDDSLQLNFWFDAGSTFDARTNSLGQQSGTFDIANVQLEFGDTATEFEYVSPADQLVRCQRYYQKSDSQEIDHPMTHYSASARYCWMRLPTQMRAAPSITVSNLNLFENGADITGTITANLINASNALGFDFQLNNSVTTNQGGAALLYIEWTADAEL